MLKNISIYLIASILNKSIPFLLLPILTRYLSPEEYGILGIYQVLINFSRPFIGMNSGSVITRNFFKKEKTYISNLIFNLFVVISITSTIVFIIIFSFLFFDVNIFDIPSNWLLALPLLGFFNMINIYYLVVLRNDSKAVKYGSTEILRTVLNLSISIILIVYYSYSWEGRVFGIYFASILMGVYSIYMLYKSDYLSFGIDKIKIKEILVISIPLIPHVLGAIILNMSDRIFIQKMLGNEELGIYHVAYQFGMIMSIIVAAVNKVWAPWIYKSIEINNEFIKQKIVRTTYILFLIYLTIAFLIFGLSIFLFSIMIPFEYHSGINFIIWILLGYAFFGMYNLLFPYGVIVAKTKQLGITTFFVAGVNLLLNYYLINLNGTIGAAQATCISFFIMFIITFFYSNKLYPMPWFKFLK